MLYKHPLFKRYSLSLYLIALLFINGDPIIASDTHPTPLLALNATISASFSDKGRLWRLIPTQHAMYVDFSDDNGQSFSQAVRINPIDQKISVWPENPPAIKISASGRINVLYYANETQKSTSFFSYSDDNGHTFSPPSLTSDHAHSAMHYMDKMLVDKNNKLYLFWHDTRHTSHDPAWGADALSLYYSTQSSNNTAHFSSQLLSNGVCSCCRTAVAFSNTDKPVVFARMVYKNGIRDHALIRMDKNNTWHTPQRATTDNWVIEACPEHGPSIAIDNKNRTHLTWFTLGDKHQGIFYAHSDNFGKTLSTPLTLGNKEFLPSHADVISLNQRVIITWKEFNGEQTTLHIKESLNRGESWLDKKIALASASKNSHPKLISNQKDIFLSWTTQDEGYQLLKL